jgi:3-methyl-2-oxobutanoate hydroxymethyltransferase
VADLPWMSYHVSVEDTVRNAAALVRAGASAVKLEGGAKRVPMIEAIVDAEIPVMGHIGLTPQSVHAMGGFKVQGKDFDAAKALERDAEALVEAGVFSIVLEGVPDLVARRITELVPVPTLGIGAGRWCDGQVLVLHDVLGLQDGIRPKFVRRYASLKQDGTAALAAYAADVRSGAFPGEEETYHLPAATAAALADEEAEITGLYGGATMSG